jgi:SAM-dependent methyltransferase
MDAGGLAFADSSFDMVIADELLEHLPDHRPFMREALRVLKPEGRMICATVNRVHSFGTADDPLNRNHFREFDAADFREELGGSFREVEILGQGFSESFNRYMYNRSARGIEWLLMQLNVKHKIPASLRARVRGWITGVKANEARPEEFAVTDRNVEQSLYLVAVAGAKRPA